MSHDQRGATAVEYALLAGLIAVVIAGAVGAVGQAVIGLFDGLRAGMGW